ncbi:polysaccharide biosynthesis protein [Halobacillus fulvus]|nr:polysaccharide biosynthesis protein [Halobacillus fulvus]
MSRTSFIKSTFILSVATLLSKFLGAIFRIPLQNIAGDEVLGIFSMVYPIYMVALILSVAGIPLAISKLIAEARVEGNEAKVSEIYKTASILAVLFGILSFVFIFSIAEPLSSLLGGEESKQALIIVSMTLLIAPYMAVYRGYFQGYESMTPTAASQVIEQFVRVAVTLTIAYFLVQQGASDDRVAAGVMVGSSVGALFSLFYLLYIFKNSPSLPKSSYSIGVFRKRSRQILKVSIPIAVGAITMALMNFIDAVTIPYGLTRAGIEEVTYSFGIYGRGVALVQIATVFATSLVLPLIPLVTKKLTTNESSEVRRIVKRAFTMTHLLSWPAAVGLLALALPLNLALFTNLEGSLVMAILGLSSVFTSLAVLGTGILQGLNKPGKAAMLVVLTVAIKGVLNIVVVEQTGLLGAAVVTLLIYLVLHGLNMGMIHPAVGLSNDLDRLKAFLASLMMGGAVGGPLWFLSIEEWDRLTALLYSGGAVLIGAVLYSGLLLLMKVTEAQALVIRLRKR